MPDIRFRLNGVETTVDADPDRSLLSILRGPLGMTGPHFGCGSGECGACNVIVGNHAVAACDTPAWSVAGKDITTIEGLGSAENPHPLQRAFIAEQALQCGYCISGILMSAAALLMQNPKPTGNDVKAALDRNLCRCATETVPREIDLVVLPSYCVVNPRFNRWAKRLVVGTKSPRAEISFQIGQGRWIGSFK